MSNAVETERDIARLCQIAESWSGTPWCSDGAVKRTGVSCSRLPHAILREYGMTLPEVTPRRTVRKSEILAACEEWLDGSPDFCSIELSEIRSGDVMLFDVGIGHMALSLGGQQIVQAWQTTGVHITYLDPRLAKRLKRAWRPIK
jgi:cell wall-associated NlpC family hydrolase